MNADKRRSAFICINLRPTKTYAYSSRYIAVDCSISSWRAGPNATHAYGNDARVLPHDAREEVSRSVRYLDLSPGDRRTLDTRVRRPETGFRQDGGSGQRKDPREGRHHGRTDQW